MEFKRVKNRHYKRKVHRKKGAGIRERFIFCMKAVLALSVLAVFSLILIFGYDCITQSDYFRAETIDIQGNRILSAEDVIRETLMKPGDNILAVNLSLVRKRLMSNGWISEAEVARKIPSGIILKINEHRPIAVLDLGKEFILNDNGEIFKEREERDTVNLPIVKGLKFSDLLSDGADSSRPFKALMDVLELGRTPQSVLPNSSIVQINIDREIGLTVYAFNKTIKLGYNNYPEKYERLEKVFYHAKNGELFSDFETVDLNNLSRIVIRPLADPAEKAKEDKKEVLNARS